MSKLVIERSDRVQRRLCIQRVEDRLDEQEIHATLQQRTPCIYISRNEFVKRYVSESRVVDIRRNGRGAIGRTQYTGDKPGHAAAFADLICDRSGQSRRRQV